MNWDSDIKKINKNRKGLVERIDIINQRIQFLRTIKIKREKGYTPIYLDETWVDTNHTTSHQWTSPDESQNRKIPLGKGQRFVVLHAGCETGFLKGCDLVFKGMSTDGRDYHTEMNGKVFEQWVDKQLVPALPPKSLIVMDNASYHSVRVDGTKAPTSNSQKVFLNEHGLKFDSKFTKPKLYEIIKSKKIAPVYKVDEFLKKKGHDVLRLPPLTIVI
ncbi:uncharacterized protein [Mytilus edulis]|uniref:uncharacterized protein n=1 Tax=Mytilus edulis TaxID=6550 RepID=UPI0039F11EB1